MVRDNLDSLASLFIMAVGRLVFISLTAMMYGPAGQGIVALAIAFSATGTAILGLGIEVSNTHFAGKSPQLLATLRRNSLLFSVALLPVSAVAVIAASAFFGETILEGFTPRALTALFLMVPLQVFYLQAQGLLIGLGKFRSFAIASLVQYGFLVLGLAMLFVIRAPVSGVLFLWCAGLAVKSLACLLALPSSSATSADPTAWAVLRGQTHYGLRAMPGNLAGLVSLRFDTYLIAYFWSPSHVGWYSIAATVAEAALYVPRALGQVLLSSTSRDGTRGESNQRRIRDFFLTTTYANLGLMVGLQVFLAPTILLLLGNSFAPAIAPARILIVAAYLNGIGELARNLVCGAGRPSLNTRAGVAAALLNIGLNLFAIPKWGLMGAAAASLISYGSYCVINVIQIRRFVSAPSIALFLFRPDRHFLGRIVQTFRDLAPKRTGSR